MQFVRATKRLLTVVKVLRRHGIFSIVKQYAPHSKITSLLAKNERFDKNIPRGARLREALEDLGPFFVKFGQLLSIRPDLIPEDIANELIKLQDQVPPFSNETAFEIIEKGLKQPINDVFSNIDEEVLASASIAQVYDATLKTGEHVIVKVVRPDIEAKILEDIETLYALARLFKRIIPQSKRLNPIEVVAEFENTLHEELDMVHEASNASQLRANFQDSDMLYVPRVYFDYCSPNVLVMERINAIPIRNVEEIRAAGIDIEQLANNGVKIFFTQAFKHGFFHADMHPGNILVGKDGRYQAIDFGIMGTLSSQDRQFLSEIFISFFNRDYRGVAQGFIRAGYAPASTRVEELEGAIRAVGEPIFSRPISEISFGRVLVRLLKTARRFGLELKPQLVLLEKSLLQIEGLGRMLYPQLDLWTTAKPFLEEWMDEQIGFEAAIKSLKNEAPRWANILPQLPNLAADAMVSVREQRRVFHGQADEIAALRAQLQIQNRVNVTAFLAALTTFIGLYRDANIWFVLTAILVLYIVRQLSRIEP